MSIGAVVAAAVVGLLPVFSLEGAGAGPVLCATGACTVLAAFHACVAWTVGAAGGSRGRSVAVAVAVLVVGYVLDFIVPLSESLTPLRTLSPWYWTIGTQPVTDGIRWGGLAGLVVIAAGVVIAGALLLDRRDIRSV